MVRRIFFTIYGSLVGAGYAALICFTKRVEPAFDLCFLCLSLLLILNCGYFGYRIAIDPPESDFLRFILLPVLPPLVILLAPIALAIFLFIVCPIRYLRLRARERRFRNQLKSRGRCKTLDALRQQLEAGQGTLITEIRFFRSSRIWWTEDNLREKDPIQPEETTWSVSQEQNYRAYVQSIRASLHPESGRAFLMAIPARCSDEQLARLFPRTPVITLWPSD